MAKMVYDPKTKKMTPQAEARKSEKADKFRVNIGGDLAGRLLYCAKEDGIDLAAETEQGTKVRRANTVAQYTKIAVQEFLDAREAVVSES